MILSDKKDSHSAAQALLIIEPGLVSALATRGLPQSELEALDSLNDQMMELAHHNKYREWRMLDRYFHIKLANNIESSEVKLITCSLLNRLNRRPSYDQKPEDMIRSVNEHKAIVHSLREKDETLAFDVLKLHRMRQIAKGFY